MVLLSVQTVTHKRPTGRPQARVRRTGRPRPVPGPGPVPGQRAPRQSQDGPEPGRAVRLRHHQDDRLQVQVRPAGRVAREQPPVRTHPVLAADRFVQVSAPAVSQTPYAHTSVLSIRGGYCRLKHHPESFNPSSTLITYVQL